MNDRIFAFSKKIESIGNYEIQHLPDLSNCVRHDGKFTRIKTDVKPGFITYKQDVTVAPRSFIPYPLRRISRENSRHEVHFGLLDNDEVAVKDGHVSLTLGEHAMTMYFQKLGLPTYELLGIVVDDIKPSTIGEYLVHGLTIYDSDVLTLDAMDWNGMTNEEFEVQVTKASLALSGLGKLAIKHGDAELKNYGQKADGTTFMIDLEHAVSFRDLAEISSDGLKFGDAASLAQDKINKMIRIDIRSLKDGIEVYLRRRGRNPGGVLKVVKRTIIEPYISDIENTEYEKCIRTAIDDTIKVFKQEIQ